MKFWQNWFEQDIEELGSQINNLINCISYKEELPQEWEEFIILPLPLGESDEYQVLLRLPVTSRIYIILTASFCTRRPCFYWLSSAFANVI
jgi:hypothetical protein